jgi:hypothetical protein
MWVTECAASSCIPLAIHVSFSGWLVAWLHRAYHPAKQQSHSSTFYRIPRFGCFAGARVNWHLISSFYMKCHQKWQGWDRERGRDTKDYQAILSRCFILRIPMTIGRHVAAQIHQGRAFRDCLHAISHVPYDIDLVWHSWNVEHMPYGHVSG